MLLTLHLCRSLHLQLCSNAYSQVKQSGFKVWLLWADQSSPMAYIYHINHSIAITPLNFLLCTYFRTLWSLYYCLNAIDSGSSEVWVVLLYNVYCQAAGHMTIEKTIITRGNSFQNYNLQSGMCVRVWEDRAGLKMFFSLSLISFRSRKFHNFMEKCMIKNFLFRPTSANMLHHPFVQNIKNEGHVVESLKKHLTGIIKKRQKKGWNMSTFILLEWIFRWEKSLFIFAGKIIFNN